MSERLSIGKRIAITARGYGLLRKYCPGLAGGKALSALIAALRPFATIWFSARVIDELAGARDLRALALYASAAVLINLAAALLKNVVDKVCSEREALMWSFFGRMFADKQQSLDYADLENAEVQRQKRAAEENLYMFGNGMGQLVWGIGALVEAGANLACALGMTVGLFASRSGRAAMDGPLAAVAPLLCAVLGGLFSSRAFVRENRLFEAWCAGTAQFNRVFSFFGKEMYTAPERAKDLRIYEQRFLADEALDRAVESDAKNDGLIGKMALCQAAAGMATGVSYACCYLFVALKALFGAFGVGGIVQYAGALSRLGEGIKGMMFALPDNAVYCAHLSELFAFLDIPNRARTGALTPKPLTPGGGDFEIEFRNVGFKYPSSEAWALRDVSLRLRAGERLALVGRNGSGKSTLVKLLCRLYEPTEGEILLNGADIRSYDYDQYLALFSVVFQDFKLFSLPLGQNVAAAADYDRARAEQCLIRADFGERLKRMPAGLDTPLYKDFDENGVEISGGEAQKLALARALYKDAPFIVLDEPTAALDPIAECEVYTRFGEIIGGKTSVYISHRLASCRFCDEIIVFRDGRLAQRGSHEDLLAQAEGEYLKLWMAQRQYYSDDSRDFA